MPTLLAVVEEATIVQNEGHGETSATLEHMVTQIIESTTATRYSFFKSKPKARLVKVFDDDVNASMFAPSISEKKESLFGSEGSSSFVDDNDSFLSEKTLTEFDSHKAVSKLSSNQSIRITTSIPYKRCDPTCSCQCHVHTRYQSPPWLSAVVGTLFYSSTRPPALNVRPCNTKTCLRSTSAPRLRLTYYFPTWMMKSALVYSTWGNLGGTNSSWMIRMPREVSLSSPCWRYLHKRNEEAIRHLVVSRQMSPYDVDTNGFSVLYVSAKWVWYVRN